MSNQASNPGPYYKSLMSYIKTMSPDIIITLFYCDLPYNTFSN